MGRHGQILFAVGLVAGVSAGCGSGNGPTMSVAARADTVHLYLYSVTSPATCEDVFTGLDGGEFVWRVAVSWPDGTSDVIDATPRFPDPAGYVTLLKDQAHPIDKEVVHVMHSKAGDSFTVSVQVSEIDFDLFGNNPTEDSRMNRALGTSQYTYYSDAVGWPLGQYTTWVRPDPACQFRADYALLP